MEGIPTTLENFKRKPKVKILPSMVALVLKGSVPCAVGLWKRYLSLRRLLCYQKTSITTKKYLTFEIADRIVGSIFPLKTMTIPTLWRFLGKNGIKTLVRRTCRWSRGSKDCFSAFCVFPSFVALIQLVKQQYRQVRSGRPFSWHGGVRAEIKEQTEDSNR